MFRSIIDGEIRSGASVPVPIQNVPKWKRFKDVILIILGFCFYKSVSGIIDSIHLRFSEEKSEAIRGRVRFNISLLFALSSFVYLIKRVNCLMNKVNKNKWFDGKEFISKIQRLNTKIGYLLVTLVVIEWLGIVYGADIWESSSDRSVYGQQLFHVCILLFYFTEHEIAAMMQITISPPMA